MKKVRSRGLPERWYIEPLNTASNESIAEYLSRADRECPRLRCGDNQEHDLWECQNYRQVAFLEKSIPQSDGLRFKVWCQRGNGKIVPWKFAKSASQPKGRNRGVKGQPLLFPASALVSA